MQAVPGIRHQAVDRTAGTGEGGRRATVAQQRSVGTAEHRESPEHDRLEAVAKQAGCPDQFLSPQCGGQYLRRKRRPCQRAAGSAQVVEPAVGPGGGNAEAGQVQQQPQARQPDRPEPFTPAADRAGAAGEQGGNVAADPRRESQQPVPGERVAVKPVQAPQDRGRVGGAATEPGAGRHLLADVHPAAIVTADGVEELTGGPAGDVLFVGRQTTVVGPDRHSPPCGTDGDDVGELDRCDDGDEVVVAVGPPRPDPEAEVDLRVGGKLD